MSANKLTNACLLCFKIDRVIYTPDESYLILAKVSIHLLVFVDNRYKLNTFPC